METTNFDLFFLETEPKTKGQLAHVYVKSSGTQTYAGVKTDKLVSSGCTNFRELDAEIRRLQTELEEIRARARKKFARAQALAA